MVLVKYCKAVISWWKKSKKRKMYSVTEATRKGDDQLVVTFKIGSVSA